MSNYREDAYLANDDRSGYRDGEDPAEIVSLPASLQRHFDRADALLRQDRPSDAMSALQQAGADLARTSPELFVLAVARQMGFSGLHFEQSEMETSVVLTERFIGGVRVGCERTTTTNAKRQRRSIRLD